MLVCLIVDGIQEGSVCYRGFSCVSSYLVLDTLSTILAPGNTQISLPKAYAEFGVIQVRMSYIVNYYHWYVAF